MKKGIQYIIGKKERGVPITAVTAYDYPTALILDEAEIDIILVGDSVGTNYLGYKSERDVTLWDMAHHTKAVSRAAKTAFVIADLPYGRADGAADALWCAKILAEAGADCVKIEGWDEKANIIKALSGNGISVCAHIGYNPQIHNKPQVFGKDDNQAAALINSAEALCTAGAGLIVLEMVPKELAGKISKSITAPTIGIGSGNLCDGQVLVINDLLGLSTKTFKHARAFARLKETMYEAFKDYADAVKSREFPGDENAWI
ncbi:MAG: 3-methyl-2-oxobutanoate hydroxymethyltransferase [Chitinispirillales bacterium]|jgi:3-methyl-2-oxobutanoate hydroxymethyltransferase|nr:3-methyl-2-oxobutanoate hydroxymethyltransferase [Chitinispirillales bacterium]